ncbi:MAG: zinc-dependent peptidase [Ignavibacteriaceae bacterium]
MYSHGCCLEKEINQVQELLDHFKHHHKSDIDFYGATNPAEFFAVVTEYFFEKPI